MTRSSNIVSEDDSEGMDDGCENDNCHPQAWEERVTSHFRADDDDNDDGSHQLEGQLTGRRYSAFTDWGASARPFTLSLSAVFRNWGS